jgi:hypothetical protein
MVNARRWLLACGSGIWLLAAPSCNRPEAIQHYTVLKPPPIDSPVDAPAGAAERPAGEPKDRTLAAIVPVGSQGWFFKLTGPKDAVAAKEHQFVTFLKSLHFSAEGKPEWTLPQGWQQRGGSDIRYATLVLDSDKNANGRTSALEVSVTVLPKASGDDVSYALVNVNRWRGQLKLPPIGKEQLATETTQIELAGAVATVVNLLGTATPGGMGRAPFLSGAGDGK